MNRLSYKYIGISILLFFFGYITLNAGTTASPDSAHLYEKADSMIMMARKGEAYARKDIFDSAYVYLDIASKLFSRTDSNIVIRQDIFAIPLLYNALGVYNRTIKKDFKAAVDYFHKTIRYCEQHALWDAYASATFNIVYIFFTNNSTNGMSYASELYEKGKSLKSGSMTSIGAYCMASMYFIDKDYEKAKTYIDEVLTSSHIHPLMEANTYCLKANLDRIAGNLKSADIYFKEAIMNLDGVPASEQIYIHLSYGDYLIEIGEYEQAVTTIRRGLAIGEKHGIHDYRQDIYKLLSDAYSKAGQWENAYDTYRQYNAIMLELSDFHKQKEISELIIKYDTEKKASELARKSQVIRHQVCFFSVIIIFLSILALYIWLMYRNKNKMYVALMEKYKADTELRNAERRMTSGLNADKTDKLFLTLESMMNTDHIYRDCNLNRESLAEKLNTNRTYLSSVIRQASGKTLSQYVNSYRIAEAVQILSDKNNDVNLKTVTQMVGFNSKATFYRIFQEEVGVPPAKFRELSVR